MDSARALIRSKFAAKSAMTGEFIAALITPMLSCAS
jgi:hypothetical protein